MEKEEEEIMEKEYLCINYKEYNKTVTERMRKGKREKHAASEREPGQ